MGSLTFLPYSPFHPRQERQEDLKLAIEITTQTPADTATESTMEFLEKVIIIYWILCHVSAPHSSYDMLNVQHHVHIVFNSIPFTARFLSRVCRLSSRTRVICSFTHFALFSFPLMIDRPRKIFRRTAIKL